MLFGACGLAVLPAEAQHVGEVVFIGAGRTFHGDWSAETRLNRGSWQPGQGVRFDVVLTLAETHVPSLAAAGVKADKLCVLITAERTFDADGWLRLASDERMSTLLTPAGLAIEGGVQGAMTTRFGYAFKAPVDQLVTVPVKDLAPGAAATTVTATFSGFAPLPADLPPGFYRLRLDFGVMAGTRYYNINGYTFAARPSSSEAGTSTYCYTPLIPAGGTHVSGRVVDPRTITPRIPWLLLGSYGSNGYRGVVADEDRHRFATSDRSLIPDDVILPMYDAAGNRVAYSLEPTLPADTIDAGQNIDWDWTTGALSVRVLGPDGSVVDLGIQPIVAKAGNGPTTKASAFTAWRPQKYGFHTVVTTGWMADRTGRRYEGGGTYRFWIAKRMTLATATFQGQPYPVGASYGRDTQFNPALPADVTVTAELFVNSDPANVRRLTYAGKASPAGLFGSAQGMKPFPLDAPGEYHAKLLATHTDAEGHLWVSTMRHAGVVYPADSKVTARGKKLPIGGKYYDRGETKFEGHVHENGDQHLAHITFPYQAGDMILIAAEGQGANKIEPVLTYQMAGDTSPWDPKLNGVGTTNLAIKTSNGYSPHLYPEYITDIEYYYGAAPRPGFMGRFIVGESTSRAPYWAVSPNSFGGQIGASPNGDLPGDIYRLLGGIVMRRAGQAPMFSGYIASAFLLPKNTENNRISAPGSEDLIGATGERARFFLVGLRPGTAFETGSVFRPALQIDPMVPAAITFTLHYPDGRTQTATGTGDAFGTFAGPAAWPLDVAGVYRYRVKGVWNGHEGRMPGLPETGGHFFVYSKTRPAGAAGLRIDGASQRTVSASSRTTITGRSAASQVYFTILTPGAVIDQGVLPVKAGSFSYVFDPVAINARVPIYDITSITTGAPQLGRVIHLTFYAEERTATGAVFHDVARVVLRGTTLLGARGFVPAAVTGLLPGAVAAEGTAALADAHDAGTLVPGPNRAAATDHSRSSVRAWDARVDRLVRSGDLRLIGSSIDTIVADRRHERFQQVVDGIPVDGAHVLRQTSRGTTVSVFGDVHAGIDIDATPSVTAEDASRRAVRRAGGHARPASEPALVILPVPGPPYRLAWRTTVTSGSDTRRIDVDAHDGSILNDTSMLRLVSRPTADVTTPDIRRGGTVADLRAMPHRAAAEAFLLKRFGRSGIDGRGGTVSVRLHPGRDAAWDGRQLLLGHASSGRSWADAVDIVVHGAVAAMLDNDGGFGPDPEASSLAAGLADVIAAAAALDRAADGVDAQNALLIGEDVVPGGVRALTDPAHVVGRVYLFAIEPGRRDPSGPMAPGTGDQHRADVERALYRAWVYMLTPGATMADAREASLQSARDLRGAGSVVERALADAWHAVVNQQ